MFSIQFRAYTVVSLIAALGGAACSSDPTESAKDPVTHVDGAKALDQLTDVEAQTICQDVRTFKKAELSSAEVTHADCTARAIAEAAKATPELDAGQANVPDPKGICKDALSRCLQGAADAGSTAAPPATPDTCGLKKVADLQICKGVTVADLEGCWRRDVASAKYGSCESPPGDAQPIDAGTKKPCSPAERICAQIVEP